MPFDPAQPTNHSPLVSQVIRDQFMALFNLIQSIPAGPPGIQGIPGQAGVNGQDGEVGGIGPQGLPGLQGLPGPPFTNFVIDTVTSLPPGEPATAAAAFDGSAVQLSLGIPRGQDGVNGQNGQDGQNGVNGQDGGIGPMGLQGVPGPPFTNFAIDTVSTLPPGDPATAAAVFDGSAVKLSFGIPAGVNGQDGQDGAPGQQGLPGLNGPPFTNFLINMVSTLPPGDPATVQAVFDGSAVKLSFGIPAGQDGVNGQDGEDGQDGGVGPQGLQGLQGPAFADAIVDSVTTLNPGDNATVQTAFDGSHVRFSFGLPRGFNGTNGLDGNTGATGPQGAPFATALVDGVTTLNPGDNATVQTFFDGMNVHLSFGIPRGQDGLMGPQGIQGPPGNVNATDLANAITGTSSNSNLVATLDTPFANDPPTLADLETMRAKVNELISALRR